MDEVSANAALAVYPNPSNGNFVLELKDAALYEVRVFDSQGRLVHTDLVQGPRAELRLNDLPAGVYSFSLLNGEKPEGNGRLSIVK